MVAAAAAAVAARANGGDALRAYMRANPLKTAVYLTLAVFGIYLVQVVIRALATSLRRWRMLRLVPGPRGGVCGSLGLMSTKGDARLRKMREVTRTYGGESGMCRLWLGPTSRAVVLCSRPELFRSVLSDRSGAWEIFERRGLKLLTGTGLLTSRGAHWKKQRGRISPAFEFAKLKAMLGTMAGATDTLVDHLRDQAAKGEGGAAPTVDATKLVQAVTIAVISSTAFGLDINPLKDPDHAVLKMLKRAFSGETISVVSSSNTANLLGLPMWMVPSMRRVKRDVAELRAVLRASIERRLHEEGGDGGDDSKGGEGDEGKAKDLLGLLLAARDEETGERMTTEEVMDEVMTFFLAGQDTTATLVDWMLRNFVDNPEWCARVVAEIDAHVTPRGRQPVYEDLASLEVLDMCMRETLRRESPVPLLGRVATRDVELGGFQLPAGTVVLTAPWLVHHNPDVWGADCDAFDPARFGRDAGGAKKHDYSFMPFSSGMRRCIGANLAMLEAKVMVIRLLQAFEVRGDASKPPTEADVGIVRRPESVWVKFVPRTD
uniref:Cytochrome P450 n=1 Tax=Bicosoecida sp. CB-2014 TaxID=1486930 RepID=A0A7S1CP77_9STRA